MQHCTVVIATRNRWSRLVDVLKTIPRSKAIRIAVVCDADSLTYRRLQDYRDGARYAHDDFRLYYIPDHVGAVAARNLATRDCEDGVLYATDDIMFCSDAIQNAMRMMGHRYPDDDGVIGLVQEPCAFHKTGVALVSKAFLARYPEKQLFCPDYWHFACQEVLWLSEELGRFTQCHSAKVLHYHPGRHRELIDDTHADARKYRTRDMEMIKLRQKYGMVWGRSAGPEAQDVPEGVTALRRVAS